jgi:signal peptidase I
MQRNPVRRWPRLWRDALLGALATLLVHGYAVRVSVVRGCSMEPALHDGDRLVVDRFGADFGGPQRGELIVLRYPLDPTLEFVKRVVGMPGDRVAMQGGVLLVNGIPTRHDAVVPDADDFAELVVPGGHYFVLGDNRPVSCDSRSFGLLPAELVCGRVRARFWPPAAATMF